MSRISQFAAVVAVTAALPATALGAEVPGPKVVRIDPSTGAQTVLGGGAPLTHLSGVAVGPTGTVYVANRGRRARASIRSAARSRASPRRPSAARR
jgi:hypothetical protein